MSGQEIARRWRSIQGSGECHWQERAGVPLGVRLRSSLETVVAAFPLEHPHYPASYGNADASITGGDGQDWKPVYRERGDTVSTLPISALLAQALVAFAMEYEKMSPVALSLSTSIIKRIPREGDRVKELGDPIGISALVRHGFLRERNERGRQTLFLTPMGAAVGAAYDERIATVEAGWRYRFGLEPVSGLRLALEELTS